MSTLTMGQTVYLGTGRRKSAVARVRIREGKGEIKINGRELEDFFTEVKDRGAVLGPLELVDLRTRVNVFINVHGGGITGQAGACMQGIARALKDMFGPVPEEPKPAPAPVLAEGETAPEPSEAAEATEAVPETPAVEEAPTPGGFARRLRDSGFLTRDSRMKERKKYGRKGARKSFQFSKR